jgi:DNA-binding HxlR family transcriptional regulator
MRTSPPDPADAPLAGALPTGASPAGIAAGVAAGTAAGTAPADGPAAEAWPLPGRPCSVAAALHVVGDRWSLLVVRELIFDNHRFDQLAKATGAPRDRLAARLASLVEAGVVEKRRYSERPPRFEYHLTEAGWDLVPVVRALRSWGDRWAVDEPPAVFYNVCGHAIGDHQGTCPECGAVIDPRSVRAEMLVAGWDARGPVE